MVTLFYIFDSFNLVYFSKLSSVIDILLLATISWNITLVIQTTKTHYRYYLVVWKINLRNNQKIHYSSICIGLMHYCVFFKGPPHCIKQALWQTHIFICFSVLSKQGNEYPIMRVMLFLDLTCICRNGHLGPIFAFCELFLYMLLH